MRVLLTATPIALLVLVVGFLVQKRVSEVTNVEFNKLLTNTTGDLVVTMAPTYLDANGDLVADPPSDPAAFIKPEVLIFSDVPGDRDEENRVVWQPFLDHLTQQLGVKVEYATDLKTVGDQLQALRDGRLHLTILNTGVVQTAVNSAGFTPLYVPADNNGKFTYEMELIVPKGSAIKTPNDLKGKFVIFTDTKSNSGFKVPLVLLRRDFKLEPGVDYDYKLSGSHFNSIGMVKNRKFAGTETTEFAAAVANDLLTRLIADGTIGQDDYVSIFKSEAFPPACLGRVHNLDPELASKLDQAITSFDWKGTTVAERYAAEGKTHFVPIDYKASWALIRDVDAALLSLRGRQESK